MRYADEVRGSDGIDLGDPVELKDTELELAHQLVAKLSRESFDPSRYEDGYRSAVLAAVEAKLEGEEVAPRRAQPEQPILDLVEALQRSLARKPAKTRRSARSSTREHTRTQKIRRRKAAAR